MNSLRMARPSRHKSVYTRKIEQKIKETKQRYDVQVIQSQSGQNVQRTIRRGGDPQRDWMRWRQSENAILDLLTPEAKKQLLDAGLKIKAQTASGSIEEQGGRIYYSPFEKRLNIPSNIPADWIRHELTHAGLALTPGLFPDVDSQRKFASGRLGTFKNIINPNEEENRKMLVETAAITVGGAFAYPGYQAAFRPEQFSNFFNVSKASWQYPTQPGWTITEESKWKTYR